MQNGFRLNYRGVNRIIRDWATFFNKSDSPIYNTAREENRPLNEVALEYIKRWEQQKFDWIEEHIHGFDREDDRIKATGEVFTPGTLVNEMLDKLPKETFTDPSKTFLDPACGSGQFLVYVVYRKIFYGSTVEQALQTTYGVELMQDNVNHCKERLLAIADDFDDTIFGIAAARQKYGDIVDHNIVCANSLTEWDFENWKPIKKQMPHNLLFDPAHINQQYVWNHPNKKHFEYNQALEEQIISIIPDMQLLEQTDGFAPEYDVIVSLFDSSVKLEIKTTGRVQLSTTNGIDIEFSRLDGSPSGLTATKSDYYMILSTEFNKGKLVGKIRLFPKIVLVRLADKADTFGELYEYPQTNSGPGSVYFELDPYSKSHDEAGGHVWVGDFAVNEDGTWDLTKLMRRNAHIESNIEDIRHRIVR